jgi:phosphoribosyl 1,2-cyclic phosphodiesterase
MALFIASLNSGSNGNCYYIGNQEEAVLVDVGISCREIGKRMEQLGLDPTIIKAVFITHEHTDHISGLPSLVKKYRLPIYITGATYRATGFSLDETLVRPFMAFQPVHIGGLSVTAFPKKHDADDPHSVVITSCGITVGVLTDIGIPCKNVIQHFSLCHAVFLEANYDADMLARGRYPFFLKKRITAGHGHLSNAQALDLFLRYRPSFMTHVLLSHLSKENNNPALVEELFNRHAGGVKIVHAPRDRATAVYHICESALPSGIPVNIPAIKKKQPKAQLQLRLF